MIRLFAHVAAHVLRGDPLDTQIVREGVASAQEVLGPAETLLARAAAAAKLIQAAAAVKGAASSDGLESIGVRPATPAETDAPAQEKEEPPRFCCTAPACRFVAVYGLPDSLPTFCQDHVEMQGKDTFRYVRLRGHSGGLPELFDLHSPSLGVSA
jgi:hypothetical protein